MVGLRFAKDLKHLRQQAIRTRAHVLWGRTQPPGVHTDHASHSVSQAAQDVALLTGQSMLILVVPR